LVVVRGLLRVLQWRRGRWRCMRHRRCLMILLVLLLLLLLLILLILLLLFILLLLLIRTRLGVHSCRNYSRRVDWRSTVLRSSRYVVTRRYGTVSCLCFNRHPIPREGPPVRLAQAGLEKTLVSQDPS